jgi:uncharacterized membrane protein
MTEIIVAGFSEVYRTACVLNELRCASQAVDELDDAIIVAHSEHGELRVQRTLAPTTDKSVAWGNLWGSLIDTKPMIPEAGWARAVAKPVTAATGQSAPMASTMKFEQADARWRQRDFGISFDFIHDVEALLRPGTSAIFLLLRAPTGAMMIDHVRAYGATVIRTWLSTRQDARLQTMLTDIAWNRSGLCIEPGPEQLGGLDIWSEYYRYDSLVPHRQHSMV